MTLSVSASPGAVSLRMTVVSGPGLSSGAADGGSGRPTGSSSDPDDWFASAGVRPPARPRGRPADTPSEETVEEPDWLEAETREASAPPAPPAGQPRRHSALLGLVAFAVIVVMAFLGAASSSNKGSSRRLRPRLRRRHNRRRPRHPRSPHRRRRPSRH